MGARLLSARAVQSPKKSKLVSAREEEEEEKEEKRKRKQMTRKDVCHPTINWLKSKFSFLQTLKCALIIFEEVK